MTNLIGISGKFGSGKDATADVLVKHFGFLRFSFAWPLRSELATAIASADAPDCAPEDVREILKSGRWEPGDVHLKPTPAEIRRLTQWWGTDYRRKQDQNYWVNCMDALMEQITSPIVIPDVRFANEAEFIRSRGGKVWLIERADRAGYDDPTLHAHLSERFCEEYRDWDLRIANNGTLADLESKVLAIMRCQNELARIDAEIASGTRCFGIDLGQADWHSELRQIYAE